MRSCIRPRLLCLLAAIALALPGCSYVEGYWKDSKKFYYTHINRPEQVDLSVRTVLEGKESALVQRMMVLDGELVKLEKASLLLLVRFVSWQNAVRLLLEKSVSFLLAPCLLPKMLVP